MFDRHHDIWSPRILAPGVSIWTLILRSYYCWWRTRDSRWPRYDDGWVVVLTASSQRASSPIVSSELNCFNNKTSSKTIRHWPEAPAKSNIWNVFNALQELASAVSVGYLPAIHYPAEDTSDGGSRPISWYTISCCPGAWPAWRWWPLPVPCIPASPLIMSYTTIWQGFHCNSNNFPLDSWTQNPSRYLIKCLSISSVVVEEQCFSFAINDMGRAPESVNWRKVGTCLSLPAFV